MQWSESVGGSQGPAQPPGPAGPNPGSPKGRAGKELGVRAGATLTTGREGKSVLATRVWGQEVGSPLHSS